LGQAYLIWGVVLRHSRYVLAISASEPEIWPAETTQDADLLALLAHWEKLRDARSDRSLPLRAVASGEIGRLLKYVHLCDVVNGGGDFRWRIIGLGVFPGLDTPVGQLVSQHPDMGVRLRFPILMRKAVATKAPVRGTARRESAVCAFSLESIWLPFGDQDVKQVMGMVVFRELALA